jgi:hypothetical protein
MPFSKPLRNVADARILKPLISVIRETHHHGLTRRNFEAASLAISGGQLVEVVRSSYQRRTCTPFNNCGERIGSKKAKPRRHENRGFSAPVACGGLKESTDAYITNLPLLRLVPNS